MYKMHSQIIRVGLLVLVISCFASNSSYSQKSILTDSIHSLRGVEVTAKSVQRIDRSAYNAVTVDMEKLRDTNLDLSGALDRVSGVSVRADGGVGSRTNINLNGFTGRRIKLFIDGVPMNGASSSFGLNNIPATLAQSIEVYKGVVPVRFGSDALGGAINIVTDKRSRRYLDASYSYGSFNTHRSNLNFGSTLPNGFTYSFTAYQNYSDNDYRVLTQYTDLQTSQVSNDEQWFRRFHDRYHNEAVIARLGMVRRPWADRLVFGLTYSQEYQQIQNANIMKIVFGGKFRKAKGWTPELNFVKRNFIIPRLNVDATLRYDRTMVNNVDTVSRTYSWTGDYRENIYRGEGVPTLAEFRGNTFSAVVNLRYLVNDKGYFSFNSTYTNYNRRTTDSSANAVQNTGATYMRRENRKNVTGLSYKYMPTRLWNTEAFIKYYVTDVTGPVNIATSGRDEYEEQHRSSSAWGFGAVGTYHLTRALQVKFSYEKTSRLPSDRELFGDGDYEVGDARLRPELSHNVNLNLGYDRTFSDAHALVAEVGFNYRNINDYIIRTIGRKGTAVSTNHGKVLGLGADLSLHYFYRDRLMVGGNFTYQDMRDREPLNSIGAESVTYNTRVPNLPYLFGNIDASYTFHDCLGKNNTLTLTYFMKGVEKFFRTWEAHGAKLFIPTQVSHNAAVTYALKGGKYNIALEANNFTDALLYDNYSLQKPGRNFAIKFRYSFSRFLELPFATPKQYKRYKHKRS